MTSSSNNFSSNVVTAISVKRIMSVLVGGGRKLVILTQAPTSKSGEVLRPFGTFGDFEIPASLSWKKRMHNLRLKLRRFGRQIQLYA